MNCMNHSCSDKQSISEENNTYPDIFRSHHRRLQQHEEPDQLWSTKNEPSLPAMGGHRWKQTELLGICIGCIVAKTNILLCVVGTNVATCFRHLCIMLNTMLQHHGTVQCAWLYAYMYTRLIIFKESVFPYLIEYRIVKWDLRSRSS